MEGDGIRERFEQQADKARKRMEQLVAELAGNQYATESDAAEVQAELEALKESIHAAYVDAACDLGQAINVLCTLADADKSTGESETGSAGE